jgi:AcrR family transcriptional regulator
MPKLKPESLARRQQHLLDAAERCFARLGIQATTMRDIFEEAGVSAGGVYVHFASKADVIEALARRCSERDTTYIKRCVVAGDATATVRNILRLAFADWRTPEARHGVRLDIALWGEALRDRRIARILERSARAAMAAIAGALADAEGSRVRAAHLKRSRVLGALILGVAFQWHADSQLDPNSLEEVTVALSPALAVA